MDILQLGKFKDFLLQYNQISEACFNRCMNTFLSREISSDEDICLRRCLDKHINANNRMIQVFMEVQPIFVQKRIEENQRAQEALEAQMEKSPENVT
ncbi:mitochondrial import inner membrane translocase subunit Tim9 isoform X2 [Ptiloglossa arizonensis]|uniref:mitochondrial import inner membrane translocase subunit Tim9 isoform X2 n=1 Tax=Ptiloglossa arizonensis TaxID=3350558 RepID=UPI003FA0C9AF